MNAHPLAKGDDFPINKLRHYKLKIFSKNKKGWKRIATPFFYVAKLTAVGNYNKPYCFNFLRKVPRFKPKTWAARVWL